MIKKIFTITLFSISAFSVMATHATAPSVYVTGQLGYANTHMKQKTNIQAINDKFIIPTFRPYDSDVTDVSNNGLAGRLAIGYQFNQNFAMEVGYLQLNKRKVAGMEATGIANLSLAQNAWDFAGKGVLPMGSHTNIYGKLGLAYLMTSLDAKATQRKGYPPTTYNINRIPGIDKYQWAPEVAIGIVMTFSPHMSIDSSWTHIQTLGKNRPGNIDFAAVGLTYNFG